MSKAVPNEQKKFDTNSKPLSEVVWKGTLCVLQTHEEHIKNEQT